MPRADYRPLVTGGRCECGAPKASDSWRRCDNCRTFLHRIAILARTGVLPNGGTKYKAARIKSRRDGMCGECGTEPSTIRGRCVGCRRAYERARWNERSTDPEKRPAIRASRSVTGGKRRAVKRMTDVTTADVRLIMTRTYCPLCRKRMTDESGLPTSKHVDHIIPICSGGTHTVANLRVICRTCNLSRPTDGSDVVGQVALWQAEPAFAPRERVVRANVHKPLPARVHCMPPAPCACGCGQATRYGKRYVGRHRISKYEHLYPMVIALLEQGHRSKRIATILGLNRDTAREIMARIERAREMSHA